jgi:hypothetical protein
VPLKMGEKMGGSRIPPLIIPPQARLALALTAVVAGALLLSCRASGLGCSQALRELRRASPVAEAGALTVSETAVLQRFGRDVVSGQSNTFRARPSCELRMFGLGYGGHWLCAPSVAQAANNCFYINYGIEQDWSLDTDLSSHNCSGVALDPTVTHPSELEPNVLFLKLAAPSLAAPPSKSWQVMSLPRIWRLFAQRVVFAVKYDCEGCEYALALHNDRAQRDEMLDFFRNVFQLNIEFHTIRKFLDSAEKLKNLAALLTMLSDAGLHLAHVALAGCGQQLPLDKDCAQELYDMGIPCDSTSDCSSFLFARAE